VQIADKRVYEEKKIRDKVIIEYPISRGVLEEKRREITKEWIKKKR